MGTQKIETVRNRLKDWGVEGILVSANLNRRWLTGFTGSFGYVLITPTQAILATDGRYWTQVGIESPDFELYRFVRTGNAIATLLDTADAETIAIEADYVTLATYNKMRDAEKKLKPISKLIDPLRNIKSADEIAKIRAAAAITDYAMAQVNELAAVGMSERALAWELERTMRERGADKMAFDIIVAAGPNAAKPHHRPSDRPLQIGDAIVVDMGAMLDGYHSDLTRTFHLGDEPSAEFQKIYGIVEEAQANSMASIRAGMTSVEADATSRQIIDAAGYEDEFMHSLGHGVGLQIHEGPNLSQYGGDQLIPTGAVITVEPGIYIEDWGGVRIEDLALVTDNGLESISRCPKNPIIPA